MRRDIVFDLLARQITNGSYREKGQLSSERKKKPWKEVQEGMQAGMACMYVWFEFFFFYF